MIRVLGDVAVAGQTQFRTRKCRELLGFLVCHSERALCRDELGEVLWPGEDPLVQRSRLRYELCLLRRRLSPDLLQTQGHDFIRLCSLSDHRAFTRAACRGLQLSTTAPRIAALEEALHHYKGEFLPGHFTEWVLEERRYLEGLYNALQARLQEDYQGANYQSLRIGSPL
jgi:DNA-binding SARP family transcriptional activator